MGSEYFLGFILLIFLSLCFKTFHLLSLLIGLEMAGLYLFCFLCGAVDSNFVDFFVLLVYLSVMACESAVGLALFVYFVQANSKDYVGGLSVLSF